MVSCAFQAQPGLAQEQAPAPQRPGYLVQVPLPLQFSNVVEVKQTLTRVLELSPQVVNPKERAVVILQFDTVRGSTGAGSEFRACAELADFLNSREFTKVKTVGFVPPSRALGDPNDPDPPNRLVGHAILVALACEDIVMHDTAYLGKAGLDVETVTPPIAAEYEFIGGRRTLPLPITMCLLDPAKSLYEVKTNEGTVFVNQTDLEKLETEGKAIESTTLAAPDQLPLFDAAQIDSFSSNCFKVSTRQQVADRYGLSPNTMEGDPTRGKSWNPVQFSLPSIIDQGTVDWTLRAMDVEWANNTNLVILNIDSSNGNLQACLQMARYLSALDPEKVRTVAFVDGAAQGPSALVALACDHLVMTPKSRLGGVYDPAINEEELKTIRPSIEDLAKEKEKPWSLYLSMLDRKLELARWRNLRSGQTRLFSREEHKSIPDKDNWKLTEPQSMAEGLSGENAEQLFIARTVVDNFDQLQTFYQIEQSPRVLEPTKTDKLIESLATFLASPLVSGWLLFGAMFLLSTEMSSPGLSVPGFLGAICLILFFWSQHFDGNAHWLEILMFVCGAIFILLEIFVIPGMGIFGIGGLLMVVCSIVLASQTFIIPRNSEELARLPVSLGMLAAAGAGFMVAIAVLRKVLPNSPYFKKMMLDPEIAAEATDRESLVDYSNLEGRSGKTITQLMPTGKARIAGQLVDVITDGRVVEKGEEVVVTEAVGNRVVVAPKVSA